MKAKMSLIVYDVERKDFVEIDVCKEIASIRKVQQAFEKGKIPWEYMILQDKNENIILSLIADSFYNCSKHGEHGYEGMEYLNNHKAILGSFVIQDRESYAKFVLIILKAINVYYGERDCLGKKKAFKNFKKVINQLYEYACVHTSEYELLGEDESFKSVYGHIYRRGLNPQCFLKAEWESHRNQMRVKFDLACQKLYQNSVREYMSGNERNFVKENFKCALSEVKDGIVENWLKRINIEMSSDERFELKEEGLLYLNEKTVISYWLWKSFLMAREKYPKAKKGIDDVILDREVFDESIAYKSSWLKLEIEYFMSVCKLTFDEAMELHKSFTRDTYEGELADDAKLKELVAEKVYFGYHNLQKRYAFMREYGEILYGTYRRYIDALSEKKFWR